MNEAGNKGRSVTEGLPTQFEIVSYRGEVYGPYKSAGDAVRAAKEKWLHQHQDEERKGLGWDLQVAGLA